MTRTRGIFNPKLRVFVVAFYDGGVLEATQYFPATPESPAYEVSLGTISPPVWNKDVKTTYSFDLWRAPTLSALVSTELRLYVRDPQKDDGHAEHIKIEYADVTFSY